MQRRAWIFLSVLCLLAAGLVLAQELPQRASPKAILAWDAPTTNADGTPCTDLAGYVVAISDATVDLRAGGVSLAEVRTVDPAMCEQALLPLVSGRAEGVYRLWARAFDTAGNESVWTPPLLVDLDSVGPQAPGTLRMKVTVIVEVGG